MKLLEVQGDLFASNDNLAHCVSADFHMSAGIAVEFKRRYHHKQALLTEGWEVGQVARKTHGKNYVFYMVTKERYFHKPAYADLWKTLTQLARWAELLGLSTMSIPPISCVRDKLNWLVVRKMIEEAFDGSDITITVYRK